MRIVGVENTANEVKLCCVEMLIFLHSGDIPVLGKPNGMKRKVNIIC